MKLITLLVIMASLAAAQTTSPLTTYFVPSGEIVGGFERIGITICNSSSTPQIHTGALLMRDAAANKIRIATHAEMLRAGARADTMSKTRAALLALEVAGIGFTVLTASDAIKINEAGLRVIAPIGSAAIRALTTYYKSQEYVPPADIRPSIVTVPPDGACVDYAVYGTVSK